MDWSTTMSIAIRYPFTLNNGKVDATYSGTKIYLDRVLTLLSTNLGQRPILQAYGANMDYALFENENDLYSAIESATKEAIKKWIPEVSVQSITIGEVGTDGAADVQIVVQLPDNTSASVSVSTASFGYSGTVTT
jgi:phage baseplate assembly protein W